MAMDQLLNSCSNWAQPAFSRNWSLHKKLHANSQHHFSEREVGTQPCQEPTVGVYSYISTFMLDFVCRNSAFKALCPSRLDDSQHLCAKFLLYSIIECTILDFQHYMTNCLYS